VPGWVTLNAMDSEILRFAQNDSLCFLTLQIPGRLFISENHSRNLLRSS